MAQSLCQLLGNRGDLDAILLTRDAAGIAVSRNELVDAALKQGATHVFFVDSDVVLPNQVLQTMLAYDKDVMSVPYPQRRPPYNWVGRPVVVNEDGQYPGLTEMEFVGAGCLLVKREVFETIRHPYFFETYWYPDRSQQEQFLGCMADVFPRLSQGGIIKMLQIPEVQEFLASEFSPVGQFSEDVNFCKKVIRHGFKVLADYEPARQIVHVGKRFNALTPTMELSTAPYQIKGNLDA